MKGHHWQVPSPLFANVQFAALTWEGASRPCCCPMTVMLQIPLMTEHLLWEVPSFWNGLRGRGHVWMHFCFVAWSLLLLIQGEEAHNDEKKKEKPTTGFLHPIATFVKCRKCLYQFLGLYQKEVWNLFRIYVKTADTHIFIPDSTKKAMSFFLPFLALVRLSED